MLKQTVAYTDFNDVKTEETLYFNISKSDLFDNLELADRFKALKSSLEGGKRELNEDEVKVILQLVKDLMQLSYGIRSADGRNFKKTPEIWADFQSTAVYDEYLFSLFQDPNNAMRFITGVFPQDLVAEAQAELEAKQPGLFATDEVVTGDVVVEDNRPAWERENREPTGKELATLSTDQLLALYRNKLSNN